jgi:uncharacterized membrane protein
MKIIIEIMEIKRKIMFHVYFIAKQKKSYKKKKKKILLVFFLMGNVLAHTLL